MDLKIYKPTTTEIPEVIQLWEEQYRYHHELDHEYYVQNSPDLTSKFRILIESAINSDNPMLLVARLDGKLVGFVSYIVDENDYIDSNIKRFGVVVELFVSENYRHKGIASGLMDCVEKYFKEQNLSHIEIQLSTLNTGAMEYYIQEGYTNRQSLVFKRIKE